MHIILSHPTRTTEVPKFYFRRKLYQFISLQNGLCAGPRKLRKLLNLPLSYLRLQQVTAAGFVDVLL